MKLWAISDLHIGVPANRKALEQLSDFREDWLILGGDICERMQDLEWVFAFCSKKFARVFWVPGNHELWLITEAERQSTSVLKYASQLEMAKKYGIFTPAEPWVTFPETGHIIVPLFTLYDYSFRPANIERNQVIEWASAENCVCTDEVAINPSPFQNIDAWSRSLCEQARQRLEKELPENARTILINHFPLREDLIYIPKAPRFTPWCGTRQTENWHSRYNADVVISGHLHVRRTLVRDQTRFEEVSLGYARQWDETKGLQHYLKQVI